MMVMMMAVVMWFRSPFISYDISFDMTFNAFFHIMQEHFSANYCGSTTKRTKHIFAYIALLRWSRLRRNWWSIWWYLSLIGTWLECKTTECTKGGAWCNTLVTTRTITDRTRSGRRTTICTKVAIERRAAGSACDHCLDSLERR
jgi:hypothetical protein